MTEAEQVYTEVLQKNAARNIGFILDYLDVIKKNVLAVNTENFTTYHEATDLNGSLSIIAQGLANYALTTAMSAALSDERDTN